MFENFSISHRIITFGKHTYPLYEQKTSIYAVVHITRMDGDLFAVFNDQMTPEEREALTFMYAYMPIGDITDYSGDFYLKNIRSSFQARNEMPWGDSIPEDIFRHFVLPVRINNENLDG